METNRELLELAEFLSREADAIGRAASRALAGGLPIFASAARRRLRRQVSENMHELSRHLQSFGSEGPRLYGESQRRYAAARLAEGMSLQEALEERAVVYDTVLDRWSTQRGPLPGRIARYLAQAHYEVTSQIAEVWLTYQRAESVAFQEAALLDTIVHHLDEAILVAEPDGVISYVSPAIEKIIGVQPHMLAGITPERLAAMVELRHKDGTLFAQDELPHRLALHTGEAQHVEFALLRRADGSKAVCEIYSAPVFDEEEGRLRGAVITLRDRTESFEQTRALQTAYADLRAMHARMLSRSRMEATGELASTLAHALKNHLNVIKLRLGKLAKVPGTTRDVEAIGRSVREIAALVGRLQEFAVTPRPEAPVPVELEQVVREAVENMRTHLAPEEEIRFVLDLAPLPPVLAEKEALLEFFLAIFLGAREYAPEGKTAEVRAERSDGFAVVRTAIRRPPISPEEAERLFEPLAPGATTRAVAFAAGRQAVQRWGGSARVYSDPEGFNVFEVRLRLVEEAASQGSAPEVLLFEADPAEAARLTEAIRNAGGVATLVSSLDEALELPADRNPAAALVSPAPGSDVRAAVERLKGRWPEIRLGLLASDSVRPEAELPAGVELFRKPVDIPRLSAFVGGRVLR